MVFPIKQVHEARVKLFNHFKKSLLKKLTYYILLPFLLAMSACQPSPKPIGYGSDMCHFCKMTIVDAQHGAEAVTAKGKVFMFDAIECLANYVEQEQGTAFAYLLVNDYHAPKELINATESHYLISQNLPSPMGAFLTAFRDKAAAYEMQKAKGGEVFEWDGLLAYLKEKGIVK